jgi:Na+/melibiose symporter-like transporter
MKFLAKHKNLIIFILLTFGRSVFLGMMKFFLWSYLQDVRTLQEIAGYSSLGGAVAYLIAGTIAYAFTKKKIILWATLVCIICLIAGYFTHYAPFAIFTLLLIVIGIMYSLWLTIKSILLSTEIMTS